MTVVLKLFKESIARNLRYPTSGPVGWYINKYFFENKTRFYLKEAAVEACNISKDDVVLEVGFGPGVGIKEVYKKIKDGNGKIYGVDISQSMIRRGSRALQPQIQAGKVELILADVAKLPFESDKFDHVYHCNCYYFWDDQVACAQELHRVMKPNANMTAAFNEREIKRASEAGMLKYGNIDSDRYMESLKKAGFQGIELKKMKNTEGYAFSVIFSHK